MKAFVSWSGGKDCLYALHKFLLCNPIYTPEESPILLNMVTRGTDRSRSHGIGKEVVAKQAETLGFPLLQVPVEGKYEEAFRGALRTLRDDKGCDTGIFGDIYLESHREWIERVTREEGIVPRFPLWGISTIAIIRSFVTDGYKTRIVAVRKGMLDERFLGRDIDRRFIDEAEVLGIDPCGEEGEYHTFVYDGPLFRQPVAFHEGEKWADDKHFFLEILV